ncbi:MAG: hypothetical protein Q8830_02755, partial [Candidatus Phytoplasma australasiaticum]|nr:hypothetical protein [Candidatus Phytoplasma australasiaticum]
LFLLRSRIGIIFQNPDYQFIGCDVKHDIAFGLENQNLSREEMRYILLIYGSTELITLDKVDEIHTPHLWYGQLATL